MSRILDSVLRIAPAGRTGRYRVLRSDRITRAPIPNTQYPILLKPRSGFTLTELLIVIGIIGILTGLVATSYAASRAKARDNTRQADLATVASALELYRSDRKRYPAAASWSALQTVLSPRYIANWPDNPKGLPYRYAINIENPPTFLSAGERFYLDATLERMAAVTITDPNFAAIESDPSNPTAFQTGVWQDSDGVYHYRLSGR